MHLHYLRPSIIKHRYGLRFVHKSSNFVSNRLRRRLPLCSQNVTDPVAPKLHISQHPTYCNRCAILHVSLISIINKPLYHLVNMMRWRTNEFETRRRIIKGMSKSVIVAIVLLCFLLFPFIFELGKWTTKFRNDNKVGLIAILSKVVSDCLLNFGSSERALIRKVLHRFHSNEIQGSKTLPNWMAIVIHHWQLHLTRTDIQDST